MHGERKVNRDSALAIARRELRKHRRARKIEFFLFFSLVLSVLALCFILLSSLYYTGFASYIDAEAGTITSAVITAQMDTEFWHGLHGLALRVPGYVSQLYEDLDSGYISSTGLFFDCMENNPPGGREIYASTSSSISFATLEPATVSDVDTWLGCSGRVDCAINTFTDTMSIMVGGINISDIPSTYTFQWGGGMDVFKIGVLTDGTNLVYVTILADSIITGYGEDTIVNFQMLLPVVPNETHRYYFFNDPNDECPPGGSIGDSLDVNVGGYIKNSYGNPVENATVILTGSTNVSNVNGYYNVSATVNVGTYNVIVIADGYDTAYFNVTFDYTNFSLTRNVTLEFETPGPSNSIQPYVHGYVLDKSGAKMFNATVLLGNSRDVTDLFGFYELYPTIANGTSPIVSYLNGFNNYYSILNFSNLGLDVEHNITLVSLAVEKLFDTGPYTSETGGTVDEIVEIIEETGDDFWISTKEIYKEVRKSTFIRDTIAVYNFKGGYLSVSFEVSPELEGIVELENAVLSVPQNSVGEIGVIFYGDRDLGDYNGSIFVTGDIEGVIPTNVKIIEKRQTIESLLIDLTLLRTIVPPGDDLKYKVSLHNLLGGHSYEVYMKKYITSLDGNFSHYLGDDRVEVKNSLSFLDKAIIPDNATDGDYQIKIDASYLNYFTTVVAPFEIRTPIYMYSFFGIPVWLMLIILAIFLFAFLVYFIYKRQMEKRKRYLNALDFSSLPKKEEHSLWLGRIAETKIPGYLQLNNLSTHCIVAGATGGGKSISAQVIVEEVLKQNVAVFVFDPTAQWSGMLRKCDDKKMLSFYPKFKMKPGDATAFPGSIHLVKDSRELVDLNKYMNPGQIQIFAMNKLDPKDIDFFVANVIRGVFRSDPKESPDVKVLLVFDEVHRLLAKFGGNGEGFLQIERACREFRKWGIGVMLVSQVLSDFVGEIKANINTEVQMRTIEENDLERIKTKYGGEFLKSLVKSEVGVGMIQNAEYNNGKPYFLQFRPILHNTRRLSDEELEQYNSYNEKADQMSFELEELEKLKIDTFDLKMELKLVKDKIMTGNFSVVDIYLQGLSPRLLKQWEKLGKKAPKMVKKLVNVDEVKKSIEEAKKSRADFEQKQKAEIKSAKVAVVKKIGAEKAGVVSKPGLVQKKIIKNVGAKKVGVVSKPGLVQKKIIKRVVKKSE